MLRCMLLSSSYLRFKPSQVAASALLLSLNINSSTVSMRMGAPTVLTNLAEKAFYFESGCGGGQSRWQPSKEECKDSGTSSEPLSRWNSHVRDVTKLSARQDI